MVFNFDVSKLFKSFRVRHLLHKLNRISDKQLTFLTSLPVFILLVSWLNHTLTLCCMYSLLINLLSCYTEPGSLGCSLIWSSLNSPFPSTSLWCKHLWRKHLILHLYPSLLLCYSQHLNCIPSSFSTSESKPVPSSCVLSFLYNPSS